MAWKISQRCAVDLFITIFRFVYQQNFTMTAEDAKQKIEDLIEQVDYYNSRYYQYSESEISDFEFDKLLEKLSKHSR